MGIIINDLILKMFLSVVSLLSSAEGAQSEQIVGLHMASQPLGDDVGRGVVWGAGKDVVVGVDGHGLASTTRTKHETLGSGLLPRCGT